VGLVALFARTMYSSLEAGHIDYEITLDGIKGKKLGTYDTFKRFIPDARQTLEDVITVKGRVAVDDLRAGWRSLVHKVAKETFALFNWDIAEVAIDQRLDELPAPRG
jgi:hypothetical protein